MDSKVKIVDEQTGRIMEGRRYSDGLHQAIEAKENVKIEDASQTYATITLQNYFRMYNKLSGMTGTAETEAGEFWEIYKLDCVVIPTNRDISRSDKEDKIYKTLKAKFNAVIDEIVELKNNGRPILVGTTSVEISELLSRMLNIKKIPHQVLNAKQHSKEADIVAEAGKPGTVTIATNMAGRGTDIKLTKDSRDSESSSSCRHDFFLPEKGEIVGAEIRNKPPSAELRPEQLDSDSLPNYFILDPILKGLIEQHLPTKVLIAKGFDKKIVYEVANLLKNAEFKRYQAPPLLKISNKAFGSGWKKPIASR